MAVNMPMYLITRAVTFQQPVKGAKATVAGIFSIADMARWSMGNEQIYPHTPQAKPHPTDETGHFLFRVLMDTAVIPATAGKAHNAYSIMNDQLTMDTAASLGRSGVESQIMIAEDIKQWHVIYVTQGGKIFGRQVAAAYYQLDVGKM